MEEELVCAICEEVGCDLETRCCHHYHFDCLKPVFEGADHKCPLCLTTIGLKQKFEKAFRNEADISDFSDEDLHEFVRLLISCKEYSFEVPLKRLMESGWDVNEKYLWISAEPSTLFYAALNAKHYEMAFKLLEYGADFNVRNNEGIDALGVFIKYSCIKMDYKSFKTAEMGIELMIDAGCDMQILSIWTGVNVSVLSSKGEYPFELALQKDPFSQIVAILELSKHNRGRGMVRNLRIRNCDACRKVCCSLTARCGHNLHVSCMKGKFVCPVCQTRITPFDAVERFLAKWMKIKLDEENSTCSCFSRTLISKKSDDYFKNGLKSLNRTDILALLDNACECTEIPYLAIIKQLIKMKVPLGFLTLSDIYPQNIMHKACLYDHYKLVADLFELGDENVVDFSAKDEKGNTLLHMACLGRGLRTVKFLLNKAKMNVNEPNYARITPFHVACVQGDKKIVLECVSSIVPEVLIDEGVDYFLFACQNSTAEILKILSPLFDSPLLKQLPYICGNSRKYFDDSFKKYAEIVIHKKTGTEKLQMFEEALNENQRNLFDEPQCLRVALHESINTGCIELFDLLMEVLKGSIDPESDYKYLIDAAKGGNYEILKRLLDLGFSPHKADEFGFTPLMGACVGGNLKIVKTLIDLGVNVNAVNTRGLRTALYTTCVFSNDNAEILNVLIENGADVNVVDRSGLNALSLACGHGKVHIIKRLLELGLTDPYPKTNPNRCLLPMAIIQSANDDIVLEISKVIAPTATAELNEWAMIMAYKLGHKKTFKFLRKLNGI